MGSYQVKRKKQFGPVFKTNIFFRPTVFVTDETSLQQLASEEARKNLEAFFPPHHQRLFGRHSLLVQSGAPHARLRRLIQPSLSPATIRSYQETVQRSVARFCQDLNIDSYEPMVPKMRSFFISMTLQVILGAEDEAPADLARDIEIWSRGLLAPPLTFLPWSTAAKALRARKRIAEQLDALMKPGVGLIGKLLAMKDDENDSLSHDEIIDNVLTILFAGSDTTASACISLWKVLSLQPNLKLELREASTEQLDAFVDRVLQNYPPAPFSMRQNKDESWIGDYRIPPNWLVVYGFAGVLDSPVWLDTPLDVSKSPSSSLAFGGGPRKCPGRYLACLELLTFLQQLVLMEWELEPKQNLEQQYTPGYFPVDGFKLRMKHSS